MNQLLKSLRTIMLFVVFFVSTQPLSAIVGTTKGEFSVNQGTANYSLKIDVPPGVAGMEPKLSLDYSSNGGNGYMGVGWNIGGVSAITRCPQTKAVDGVNHKFGVKYNADDRFCLDGQRLINVSGTYGADGTEYRTEIDTYSKITQKGMTSDGPNSFEVKTKSGLTYRYGLYANAPSGTTSGSNNGSAYLYINSRKVFWKVKDITDTYGNRITFHYQNNYDTGENYLSKVTYSNNSVEYIYDSSRPDKSEGYSGGHILTKSARLKEVIVKTSTTEVRRYKLVYTNEAEGSKRSKVSSITEHVAEGDLKPLQFTYDQNSGELFTQNGTFADTDHAVYFIDFNNDGFVDQVRKQINYVSFYTGNGTGSFSKVGSIELGSMNDVQFGDFNGDGLIDIFFDRAQNYYNRRAGFIFNLGDNKFSSIKYEEWGNTFGIKNMKVDYPEYYVSDFNGDGLSDVLVARYNGTNAFDKIPEAVIRFSNGDGTFSYKKIIDNLEVKFDSIKIADFNADGLPDIYMVLDGADKIYINNGNKTFTHKYSPNIDATKEDITLADLNGDGLTDIYQITKQWNPDNVWINKGNGQFILNTGNGNKGSSDYIRFADFNGDGYLDIFDINNKCDITQLFDCFDDNEADQGKDYIWLNDGEGNFTKSYELPITQAYYNLQFTDINGDGTTDIVERKGSRNIWLNQSKTPNVTRITNNTDQDIKIAYRNMTNSAVYYNYVLNNKRNYYAWNNIVNDNIEVVGTQSLVYTVNSVNGTTQKEGNSPTAGYNQIKYKYFGYIINKLRGSQGFHAIQTYDDTSRMYTTEYYNQIEKPNGEGFQYTGMPSASYGGREYGVNTPLSSTTITYKDASTHSGSRAKIYEPYTYSNVQSVYDPDSKALIKSVYHNNYLNTDGLGNINKTVDRTYDAINNKNFYKTTVNEYAAEDKTNWHIGRLTKATVTHTQTDGGTVARSSTFAYNDKGVLSQEVANAGTNRALTKDYAYDSKGNKVKETVSGYGLTTATTTYGYSSDYKFQTSVTNAAGLTEKRTFDARFGTPKTLTGPNGLTTTWIYDGMGRKTEELRADGTKTTWAHVWDNGSWNSVANSLYSVAVSTTGAPFVRTNYDMLGREVGSYTYTMNKGSRTDTDSKLILKRKYYNAKGELTKEELPHYKTETAGTISTSYDKYGRAIKVVKTGPNGAGQAYTTTFSNFTQTVTDPLKHKKQTVKNAIDQTLSITDAFGTTIASTISYTYDAAGNLKTTTDSAGNVIRMNYDSTGSKTYMNDPDLGIWYYKYDAAGKLMNQWSGTAGYSGSVHASYKNYDILGRLIKTSTYNRPEYNQNSTDYSYNYQTFTYGDSNAPIGTRGKLIDAYASSKTNKTDWTKEVKTMTYDNKGRPVSTNTYIQGKGDFLVSTTYDDYSRPSTVTYPNGYKITNHYKDGYLDYVKGSDGKVHYDITEFNAFGEVAKAGFANGVSTFVGHDSAGFIGSILSGKNGSYGAGNVQQVRYTYDGLGNVLTRNDNSVTNHYLNETFKYDAMNRLARYDVSTDITAEAFANARSYQYDKLGNMTYKSGYGDYTYYADKPHAVKSVGSRSYTYDAVGNMTNRNGDKITYTPSSKPAIIEGKNGSEVRFYYGVEGQRYLKTAKSNNITKNTYYIGKGYEEEIASNSSNEVKSTIYISVGGKTVGTHVETIDKNYVSTNANYKSTYNRYFHTDALGSITAITDDAGNVVERRSYEPFGKIRAMDYGLTSNNAIIPANTVTETTRAFTGHEQIGEISGLVHMNARIYDSDIGRFLSADTIIQDPHDSQSYNRYSYVRNNPLVFTDPSGHSWIGRLFRGIGNHIQMIASIIFSAVIVAATGGLGAFAGNPLAAAWGKIFGTGIGAAIATGTVAGFTSGAILTGSLKGALQGALWGGMSAGAAWGIGHGINWGHIGNFFEKGVNAGKLFMKSALHGLSRGIISVAQGDTFKSGFASGFSSSFFSPGNTGKGGFFGRTAIASVVGGTASKLGGGKFSNGAISAAFVHMFNAEIGYRPLRGMEKVGVIGKAGSLADKDNNIVGHQHIFFDDDGTNIGYGDEGMIKNEDRSEYNQMKYYDDKILHQAVNNVGDWKADDYSIWWSDHNCQDYVNTVVNEYYRLGGK